MPKFLFVSMSECNSCVGPDKNYGRWFEGGAHHVFCNGCDQYVMKCAGCYKIIKFDDKRTCCGFGDRGWNEGGWIGLEPPENSMLLCSECEIEKKELLKTFRRYNCLGECGQQICEEHAAVFDRKTFPGSEGSYVEKYDYPMLNGLTYWDNPHTGVKEKDVYYALCDQCYKYEMNDRSLKLGSLKNTCIDYIKTNNINGDHIPPLLMQRNSSDKQIRKTKSFFRTSKRKKKTYE